MSDIQAVVGGFVAVCLESGCGRKTKVILRHSAAKSAVCHCSDCPACKEPLFGPIRPVGPLHFDSTYCAWCGERYHVGCLSPSAMTGNNLWCRACNAEWALTNDVEPNRTVPAWMP